MLCNLHWFAQTVEKKTPEVKQEEVQKQEPEVPKKPQQEQVMEWSSEGESDGTTREYRWAVFNLLDSPGPNEVFFLAVENF